MKTGLHLLWTGDGRIEEGEVKEVQADSKKGG
jgi:hypothetical protein